MKRYSTPTGSNNSAMMIGGGIALAIAAIVFTGGSDNPISQIQQGKFNERLNAIQSEMNAKAKLDLLNESAKNARAIYDEYGASCEKIVNEQTGNIAAGRYHVGLSEGMTVRDPVTKAPSPQGMCVMDHLGNVAILGPGGVIGSVFYDPELAHHDFTTDTTQNTGGMQ